MPNPDTRSWFARLGRWRLVGLVLALAAAGVWLLRPAATVKPGATFAARKGTLPIVVVENGSLEAEESQEVRSEVKGWQGVKILSIIEEGYQVTEEDVRTNKVLVELDSSEIRKNILTSDIDFEAKRSALTEAQQAYEIQVTQNKTDIKNGEQKARFARLDTEKYLGDEVAGEVCKVLALDERLAKLTAANGLEPKLEDLEPAATTTNAPAGAAPASGASGPATGLVQLAQAAGAPAAVEVGGAAAVLSTDRPAPLVIPAAAGPEQTNSASAPPAQAPPEPAEPPAPVIDFSKYAKVELLGDGEAQQKLRETRDTLLLAEKEKSSSRAKLDGTERLFEKQFVSKTELETSRLEYEQVELKVKKSATALTLFMKYEFPKQAEELLSKFEEALRALERTRKEAISKLAQARAKLKAAEQQYKIVQDQRKEQQEQLGKCTIRAKKPGLVIYGGGGEGYWWGEERIREGASIRERQPIITIPDMSKMGIKVKIHESHIKKVKKGMKARVRVDAQPEKQLTGVVTKVGVLPDSENRWMNPDLKVYKTTVSIDGTHDWLKPGMSAKVEILVTELPDVVYVPLQAVAPSGKERVCYVVQGGKPLRRVVEVGEYSDEFIEIKKGLAAGESVLLRTPEGAKQAEAEKAKAEKAPAVAPAPGPPGGPRPG